MLAKCLNRTTSAYYYDLCFSNWVEKCTTTLTCRVAAEKRRFFVPARSWTSKPRAKTTSHTKNLEVDAEPACTALTESTVKPAAADKALPVSLLYGSLPLAPLCAAPDLAPAAELSLGGRCSVASSSTLACHRIPARIGSFSRLREVSHAMRSTAAD